MAASSAAGTLQSSLDEVHAAPAAPSSSKGSTDVIRVMLREQKRECATLHANPLFKEFRDRQKRSSRTGHGHDAQAPPVIEDLEAEGQARLIDFIKSAAAEREAAPAGVWANFGKPYACLGELQQLDSSAASLLPHLNRDDLHSSQQQSRPGQRSSTQGAQAGGAGAAARGSTAEAAAAAEGGGGSGAGGISAKDQETAKLLHHKTVMKLSTVDRLEASFPAAAVKQANARRKAAKAHPHKFFNKKLAESDAADAAGSYGAHTLSCRQLPGHQLVQHHQAAVAAAAAHAEAAAASMHAVGPGSLGAAGGGEAIGSRNSIFITQRATAGNVTLASQLAAAAAAGAASEGGAGVAAFGLASSEEQEQLGNGNRQASEGGAGGGSSSSRSRAAKSGRLAIMGMSGGSEEQAASTAAKPSRRSTVGGNGTARLSVAAGHRMSIASPADSAGLAAAAAAAGEASTVSCGSGSGGPGAAGTSSPPCFKTVTELTLQQPGSNNPVTDWHNDYVKARHAGYTSLQLTLWQRSQARAAARGHAQGRAQLSSGLLDSLDAVRGRLAPGWVPGTTPDSPYTISKQHASAAAAGTEGPAAPGTRNIKPSEVELLEHFYDALCGLVERQRLSDPLSLYVVHQVKALLEGGTFLQPPLLQQLVDRLADFVRSCGLLRYNRFALPLLAFIRKCVGVGQVELDNMAAAAGISPVLFEHLGELSEAAAAAAAASGAPGHAEAGAAAVTDGSATGVGVPGGSSRVAGVVLEGSSSVARRSSRLASEAGGCAAAAAAMPPVPIETAAAAAAADIEHAVQAVPASQRAAAAAAAVSGAAGRCSSPGGKSVRVRVPGVAGHIEVVTSPTGTGQMASNCADTSGAAAGAQIVPKLDLKQQHGPGSSSVSTAAADEVLPDLGNDGCGQPLSRRVRQLQGLQSWSGGRQQQQQQQLEQQDNEEGQGQEGGEEAGTAEGQAVGAEGAGS